MRKLALAVVLAMAAACQKSPSTDNKTPAGDKDKPADTAKSDTAGKPADTAAKPADTAAKPAEPATPAPGDIPAPPDVAAPPADAEKTASGLASKVLEKGTGTDKPGPNDTVTVNYTGWTTNGKMFDSSVKKGQPATFGLGNVIKGWTEGLQLMTKGEKRRLWIPVELAYNNRPGRPAGMLVFDVELLDIKPAPKPPESVESPPKDAVKTGEIYSKVLKEGKGKQVKASGAATVDYTAWEGDKILQSTVTRGKPTTF